MAKSSKPDIQKKPSDPITVTIDDALVADSALQPKRRIINAKTIIMALSIILLIGTEIFALGGALFWSVAQLFNFPLALDYVFGGAVAIVSLSALIIVIKRAFDSETAPENQF